MRSVLSDGGEESNTKGVTIATQLMNLETLGTYEINKRLLLCFDDKRFKDGIHTLAYFHKDLREQILTDDHKTGKILTKRRNSRR